MPVWSISTEFAAYLAFPVIALATSRTSTFAIRCLLALGIILLVLCFGIHLTTGGIGREVPSSGLFRCLAEFALGVCLYRLWVLLQGRSWPLAAVLATVSFVGYAVLPIPDYAIVPLGLVALIYAIANEGPIVSRTLGGRWLEYLGQVSYSTYLLYFFVLTWVKFILVEEGVVSVWPAIVYLGATAALSPLLYHFVEIPGRKHGRALVEKHLRSERASAAVS